MRTWKPLMPTATYIVRNAWMGERLALTFPEKPWRTLVSDRWLIQPSTRRQLHQLGYFPVHRDPCFRVTEYARWFVWVPVKAGYAARRGFFSVAEMLYRAGFIHFDCDDAVFPRWRDVRLGPRS